MSLMNLSRNKYIPLVILLLFFLVIRMLILFSSIGNLVFDDELMSEMKKIPFEYKFYFEQGIKKDFGERYEAKR